jgi:hypothetical protein
MLTNLYTNHNSITKMAIIYNITNTLTTDTLENAFFTWTFSTELKVEDTLDSSHTTKIRNEDFMGNGENGQMSFGCFSTLLRHLL